MRSDAGGWCTLVPTTFSKACKFQSPLPCVLITRVSVHAGRLASRPGRIKYLIRETMSDTDAYALFGTCNKPQTGPGRGGWYFWKNCDRQSQKYIAFVGFLLLLPSPPPSSSSALLLLMSYFVFCFRYSLFIQANRQLQTAPEIAPQSSDSIFMLVAISEHDLKNPKQHTWVQ